MFFGIWGVIGVLWFWFACLRVLYLNYRHGDPALRTYNIFFLAYYITKVVMFLFVFGGLYSDMFYFTGIIGLSVSLNGASAARCGRPCGWRTGTAMSRWPGRGSSRFIRADA